MSKTLAMEFGSSGKVSNLPANIKLVDSGEITDGTVHTFTPEANSGYLLFTKEFNASNDYYRGHRAVYIVTSEESVFGTGASQHISVAASTNSGVTISYLSNGSITLNRSSSTYAFRYAFYKLF